MAWAKMATEMFLNSDGHDMIWMPFVRFNENGDTEVIKQGDRCEDDCNAMCAYRIDLKKVCAS